MTEYIRVDDDFEPEIVPERVIWLDDEQFELLDLLQQVLVAEGKFDIHFVVGVAGTGKTQVLLSLANELRESGKKVFLGISHSLKKSLTDAGFQIYSDLPSGNSIHIVDDPENSKALKHAIKQARDNAARALVVGIDPFQWVERKALTHFMAYLNPLFGDDAFISKHETLTKFRDVDYSARPKVHWLRRVYRQSGQTAQGALRLSSELLARKNPYVYPHKQDEFAGFIEPLRIELLENAEYVKESGHFEIRKDTGSTAQNIWTAIAEHMNRADRWSWTDAMLVVAQPSDLESKLSEHNVHIPALEEILGLDPQIALSQVSEVLPIRVISFDSPHTVRGEEFQDVVISISQNHWSFLENVKPGVDARDWMKMMPLHTFMTRATENLKIYVG